MKSTTFHLSGSIVLLALFAAGWVPQDYEITRRTDGNFKFTISGVEVNAGSSLLRESILFNEQSCPVQITDHTTRIIYKERSFRFEGETVLNLKSPVLAIDVRTIQYDIFGQHMHNLANKEARDLSVGKETLTGEWRALDNDANEFLTSVTFVARVRLEDGQQWVFNADNLRLAVGSLNLERKIDESDDE